VAYFTSHSASGFALCCIKRTFSNFHSGWKEPIHRSAFHDSRWCAYFRHGVSSRTFGYVDHFAFWRIVGWIRKRHLGLNWGTIRRRYLPAWEICDGATTLYRPRAVAIVRYR
jgi:hypothetical protein